MTNKFTFREEDSIEDKDITFAIKYGDGTSWPVVLQDFLFFLESTGYIGVRDKVRIEYSPFRESEGWWGDYYDSDEEKEGRATGWGENDEEGPLKGWTQMNLFEDKNENPSNS